VFFAIWQTGPVVRPSRRGVWVNCVMAMAVAGCGGGSSQRDDAALASDVLSPDQPGADGGADSADSRSDGPGTDSPCYVPTDCPAGLTCCLVFNDVSNGVVSCQPSASCVGDGDSTYIACATDADCPAARPTCTFLASTPRGDFNICE
jgi:hypothetical protein